MTCTDSGVHFVNYRQIANSARHGDQSLARSVSDISRHITSKSSTISMKKVCQLHVVKSCVMLNHHVNFKITCVSHVSYKIKSR